MTGIRQFALAAATGALVLTAPAVAQPEEPYQYAEPAAQDEAVFTSEPVVQPLPGVPPLSAPAIRKRHATTGVVPAPRAYAPPPHHASAPHYPGGYHHPAPFDRDGWLADCRERIRGLSREERGGIIGGLLGAAAGGVIGNRAWDGERLAGTLIGAGVGGLAGLAIGSAIGAADDREREDECAWHLDRHLAGGYAGHGYGYPGHAYGYGYPAVAYVPVLVAVPQRAVVRETVTEEWVDAPRPAPRIIHGKIIRQDSPAGDKRIQSRRGR